MAIPTMKTLNLLPQCLKPKLELQRFSETVPHTSTLPQHYILSLSLPTNSPFSNSKQLENEFYFISIQLLTIHR